MSNLARELHDASGSGIALQAIHAISAEALQELRSIVGVMREGSDGSHRPRGPGLDRVHELASTMSRAGVRTEVRVEGHRRPLPADVDLAAFRIVQESLAKMVRHAVRTNASVTVSYDADRVVVEIVDESAQTVEPVGRARRRVGHGIVGMRERAAAVGGRLDAAPRPEGGFRVCATFPTSASARATRFGMPFRT